MTFGHLELRVVSGGSLWIDGGTMFGSAPRILWEQCCPPDDLGRILLATNCLLIRSQGKTVLVDTGYGSKMPEKMRHHHRLENGHPLLASLLGLGIDPAAVDLVILTHLHFDHVGGCISLTKSGEPELVFPNADYVVQEWEWHDANAQLPELEGAYDSKDVAALRTANRLKLLNGDAELLPGISVRRTGGHTRGHQLVHLASGGLEAVYAGDLCPIAAHLHPLWTTSYEQFPLTTRRAKASLLLEAVTRSQLMVFAHDPNSTAGYIRTDPKRHFALQKICSVV